MEAMGPGVNRGTGAVQLLGDLAGPLPVGDGQDDLGALDESGPCGARVCELFEGVSFLGGQWAERDLGEDHGCTSFATKATPFPRQTMGVSSLDGCTTY